MGASHQHPVWGQDLGQLGRVCPEVLLPPLPFPSGIAVPAPWPTAPSPFPTLCLPGSGCPEGAGADGAAAGLSAAAAPGQKGASLSRGKYALGRQRGRETFSRKKLLPPCILPCEWLSRGLSAGLGSPSAFPPAADARRKWENNGGQLYQNSLDFPFSSTCPCLPPPGRCAEKRCAENPCKYFTRSCVNPVGGRQGHPTISYINVTTSFPALSYIKHASALQVSLNISAEE